MQRIVIVGAGTSGVAAALSASLNKDNHISLFEAGSRICRKISVSGNGRCNITNSNVSVNAFNNSKLVEAILSQYSCEAVCRQLEDWGLMLSCPDEEGRIYPLTYNSSSVVEIFEQRLKQNNINIIYNCRANGIKKSGSSYIISTSNGYIIADKIIISIGSGAQVSEYNANKLIDSKYFTLLSPSLTSIQVSNCHKSLHGQRIRCNAALLSNGQAIYSEFGEVMLKTNELSGIVIYNLSSIIARNIVKGIDAKYTVSLDLFNEYSIEQLTNIINDRIHKFGNDVKSIYSGMLNAKIYNMLSNTNDAAVKLKNWTFDVVSLSGNSQAQVIAGGIDEKYLNNNLSFIDNKDIYVCGELLNADGICGGYNLHFALASGLYVGRNL